MEADSRTETDYILVFGNIGFVVMMLILANITIQYVCRMKDNILCTQQSRPLPFRLNLQGRVH